MGDRHDRASIGVVVSDARGGMNRVVNLLGEDPKRGFVCACES